MDRKQKQKVEGEKLISRGEMRSLVLALDTGWPGEIRCADAPLPMP